MVREQEMITIEKFETIRNKYGNYASWALWLKQTDKPKSNIGDMRIFDQRFNPNLLNSINTDVVMVGLNISRSFSEHFKNFHDDYPRANDFKIRYAFEGTRYYGAYMTDIIKGLEIVDSKDLATLLKRNPEIILSNIKTFREELRDLSTRPPLVLAFGREAYAILNKNLSKNEYSNLIKITHYSHQISKENYQETVLGQIHRTLSAS